MPTEPGLETARKFEVWMNEQSRSLGLSDVMQAYKLRPSA